MKVCTDACILGAWAAHKITGFSLLKNILDIGCGTGLLSLMLAQKTPAHIDAIEINENAAGQAAENVLQSPWKHNIDVMNISLQRYQPLKNYDLIICNPPFFEDDLKSTDENKNAAKHEDALNFNELIIFIKKHLSFDGEAVVLLPFHRIDFFAHLLKESNLYINEVLFLKQSLQHKYFRTILWFSNKNRQPVESNELMIHDHERSYTEEFKTLLRDYYLKL